MATPPRDDARAPGANSANAFAHHLLTRGHHVSALFDRDRRPRPEGPLRGHPGDHQRDPVAQGADHAELRRGTARSGAGPAPSPPRRSRRRAGRSDPRSGRCRETPARPARGSAGPETGRPPGLGGRLLDGPVVGAHHQHRGRLGPSGLGQGRRLVRPGRAAPPSTHSPPIPHGPSVQRPSHRQRYGGSTPTQQSGPASRYPGCRRRVGPGNFRILTGLPFTNVGQHHYGRWSWH